MPILKIDDAVLYRLTCTRYAAAINEFGEAEGRGLSEMRMDMFRIVRYTPSGAWIDHYTREKFVNLRAVKQFASASESEATDSFIARKKAQIRILSARIFDAEEALDLAQGLTWAR